MENKGFIMLSRGFFKHEFWTDQKEFSKACAWLDLIHMAAWKDTKRIVGNRSVALEKGSLYASERFLAKRWGWSQKKVQAFLFMLQDEEMITVHKNHQGSTIFLQNYGQYNPSSENEESQKNHEGITEESQKNHEGITEESQKNHEGQKKESPETPVLPVKSGNHSGYGNHEGITSVSESAQKGIKVEEEISNIDTRTIEPLVSLSAIKDAAPAMGVTPEIAEAYWNSRDAVGWMKNNQPIKNWRSDLKSFDNTYKEMNARRNQPRSTPKKPAEKKTEEDYLKWK